jgi:hypothetical protein
MTNTQLIKFNAKYLVHYLNETYVITGFRNKSLHIKETELEQVIEEIVDLTEKQFLDYIQDRKDTV